MKIKELLFSWRDGPCLVKCWIALFLMQISNRKILGVFYFFFMLCSSYIISFKLFGFSPLPKVYFPSGVFCVKIYKSKGVKLSYPNGIVFILEKWKSGNETNIFLDSGAELFIKNTFSIGDGCKIHLAQNSKMELGGRSATQSSGITCDSIILCSQYVAIGAGTIISWGTYISDSTQHKIDGEVKILPIIIEDHVWLSEGVTCSPGCNIGAGSIVGSKSYVNRSFPAAVLLAGAPARIIKKDVTWSR